MAIRGITFSKQSVSSNDDAHIYKILLNGRKGKTKGCKMTFGTDDIYISAGYFFAANRLIEISSAETVATPIVSSGTSYCRIVFEIDLSKVNTNTAFNQGYFKILSSTSDYPEITQEDLENGGNVYQLPFAKFTKTVSGIGSFESELETIGTNVENNTIYVSKSGNDASGDGTENAPFATIQHAIDSISKNLNGKEISVLIAAGTYAENVKISGFYGGILKTYFNGVTIESLTIEGMNCTLSGTSLSVGQSTSLNPFYIANGAHVICQVPLIVTGGFAGLRAYNGSVFIATQSVTINTAFDALVAENASIVYIHDLEGAGSENGVYSDASFITIENLSTIANTQYVTEAGGRIYTGSQTNAPRY